MDDAAIEANSLNKGLEIPPNEAVPKLHSLSEVVWHKIDEQPADAAQNPLLELPPQKAQESDEERTARRKQEVA